MPFFVLRCNLLNFFCFRRENENMKKASLKIQKEWYIIFVQIASLPGVWKASWF